jgi:tRNA A-37 threonylcarbamoyl transferase component Bud32
VSAPAGPDRFDEAVAAYEEAVEAGAPLSRADLLARYPEAAPALREYFSNHDFAASMGASLRLTFGSLPLAFGRYQLQAVIGRGGMGVVFRALDTTLKRTVALKTIDRPLASALDMARFRVEAETAATLRHPNIVPVHDVGVHEGQPYYTMALVEGSSVHAALPSFAGQPRRAAALIATVAEAIHDAHRAGVIHRDLKPGNILLDAAGAPLVTDFGLAKKLGSEPLTADGSVFGTAEYMAPEQAAGRPGQVGVAADVYALGAILFELLAGRPPIAGATPAETLRLIAVQEPRFPREGPRVDPELAAVCLAALRKEPAARYATADALAEDLRRWLAGAPVRARKVSRPHQLWRLARRHPSPVAISLLAAALGVSGFYLAALNAGRRREILEANLYTARQVGREFLERIQLWGEHVSAAAREPELVAQLARWQSTMAARPRPFATMPASPEQRALQAHCERLHRANDPTFENWNLLDATGTMVARTPADQVIGGSFPTRDYFKGTLAHRGRPGLAAIHVSRVYRSAADGRYKFDISTPVLDPAGALVGVLAVSVTTGPNMGLPHLHDERRKAVLLAPADGDRGTGYVVIMHPAYAHGAEAVALQRPLIPAVFPRSCEAELSPEVLDRATSRRLDYGAGPAFTGRWLAGLAPVGNTGFVVVIQREDI